jgi:hypothetical protein
MIFKLFKNKIQACSHLSLNVRPSMAQAVSRLPLMVKAQVHA